MWANYVASIFRRAICLMLELDDYVNTGWDENGRVVWSDLCYPEDITELLIDVDEDNEAVDMTEENNEVDEDFAEHLDDDFV